LGGKDGVQEYFTFVGELLRQEQWRGYNPDAPYDTIPVYGTGSNEILHYKVVKAEQYSVPHGDWKYYDASGRITKFEQYDRGSLVKDKEKIATQSTAAVVTKTKEEPVEKVKTKEILEYEKKYSKKKRKQMERDGKTGL
jgi:alpha-glucosidase (family GH31 glycosyl hydrolase)